MKKLLFVFGIGAVILSACSGNQKKLDEDSARIAELTSEYNEATTFNDSLMLLMGDIYTGLDSINTQEGLLYSMNATGENVNRREEIRQNLSNIKARLAANKSLLDQMEKRLKDSGEKNSVLSKTIETLKIRIEQQDQKIAQLESDLSAAKGEIEQLNTQVAESQEQVKAETEAKEQAQQATIAAENEANKVYYAIGSNKELKQNGLLEKKFLGATQVLKGSFNTNYFTQADKRTLSSIPTNSKKIKVWSNMPAGSYDIVENENGTKTLRITNAQSFWSLTPYLIIQID